jgi:hypothetical protein
MLRDRLVHAAIRILEYAQPGDFAGEPVDFPLAVRIRDADEQHISGADGLLGERRIDAVRGGVDHVDAGFAYPLQYDSHTATLSRSHGGMSRPCGVLLGFGVPFVRSFVPSPVRLAADLSRTPICRILKSPV